MDWLGIGSAVAGLAGDLFSASSANSLQSDMFNKQLEFNREVMQNRHQWEVEDLRQAGLNPLMSVTSPTGTLSAPSAPSAHKADVSNSALALGQLQIADKQAEAQLISAKASAKNADTAFKAMENQGRDIDSQIKSRQFQNDTTWQMVQAQMDSARSQAELNKAQTAKTYLENYWYPRLQEANLSDIQTRIANSIAETAAKIVLMDRQGRASLTNAQAQVMLANTAEANGVSLRALNASQIDEIAQKMDIEKKGFDLEAEFKAYRNDKARYDHETFMGDSFGSSVYRSSHAMGTVMSELTGLAMLGSVFK